MYKKIHLFMAEYSIIAENKLDILLKNQEYIVDVTLERDRLNKLN